MIESKITVARVKDKVTGREAEVDKIVYADGNTIKTIGGASAITVANATTLNGETKEQLLSNVDAATVGGKTISQIQSRGKFGPIKMLPDMSRTSPYHHAMLVTEDDEILFCGYQHADMTMMYKYTTSPVPWISIPHPLKGKSKIKQLVCHYTSHFLLYENGDLYGRGYNAYYNLGIGNTANQYNWVKITDNVKKLCPGSPGYSSARSNSAVIKNDGSVWFWGENACCHAGQGNTSVLQTPTKLALTFLDAGDSVKDVYLNDSYYTSAYIITEKGKLYSCGLNDYGQLGLNDTTNRNTFQLVSTLQDKKVLSVETTMSYNAGGLNHYKIIVAKCENNEYYIWSNGYSFNVSKTTTQSNIPLLLDNGYFPAGYNQATDPIIDIQITGVDCIFALTRSGRLFAGGYNSSGFLGLGNTTGQSKFVEVTIPNEPTAKIKKMYRGKLANQNYRYCLPLLVEINNQRYLYNIGPNNNGMVGTNDTADNPNVFKRVLFDSDKVDQIKQLAEGGYADVGIFMILLNNGQYWACGYNGYGMVLGNGTANTPINYPTLIL